MLYYNEYGNQNNPTILLLHGAGALDTFSQQYCFADKCHLVVPHLPGAGKAANEIYEPEKTISDLFVLIENLHKERIGIIGHSLGSQIAVMLVSKQPELFYFAIFLSTWINPTLKTIQRYCSLSGLSAKLLHWKWLVQFQGKYWHYTPEQINNMVKYSKQITPQVYYSFFANTLNLSKLPSYQTIHIPMLAICGSKEVKDIKNSLILLAENSYCKTIMLQGANHDFPMRNAKELNSILKNFILKSL